MKEAVGDLLSRRNLPSKLLEQVPTRWERLGDIVVLPVTSFKDSEWDSLGKELWFTVAGSLGTRRLARQGIVSPTGTRDSTLEILVGHDGRVRDCTLEILVGHDGWVDHLKNGIFYSFDSTKCMFSWGNLYEELKVGSFDCKDEVIVDLFAGIGNSTLPFLVSANANMVYACEWNPYAIEALRRNLEANGVADRCIVLEGDNRVTAPKGVADRVSLGLLPSSEGSWVTAVKALRSKGGMMHVHGIVKVTEKDSWPEKVSKSILEISRSEGHNWDVSVSHLVEVGWYGHLVVDVKCTQIETNKESGSNGGREEVNEVNFQATFSGIYSTEVKGTVATIYSLEQKKEEMKEAVGCLLSRRNLPLTLLELLPTRWEQLEDIVVLPVTSFKDSVSESLGKELWFTVALSLRTRRLARQGGDTPTGTRDSPLEILVGVDGWIDRLENGIFYSFDSTVCMFSWGNLSEKLRVGRFDCKDEVIVDLFAGIGNFTLPFLVSAKANMVYACEWNPYAIEALRRNLEANGVADRCIVLEGDNRDTAPKGVADRVSLGLLSSSEDSWVTAVRALRSKGGMMHVHGKVKDTEEDSWLEKVSKSILEISRSEGHNWDVSAAHLERVKWYAPHIRHLVVDVKCTQIET